MIGKEGREKKLFRFSLKFVKHVITTLTTGYGKAFTSPIAYQFQGWNRFNLFQTSFPPTDTLFDLTFSLINTLNSTPPPIYPGYQASTSPPLDSQKRKTTSQNESINPYSLRYIPPPRHMFKTLCTIPSLLPIS